jgi:hypothetical protein
LDKFFVESSRGKVRVVGRNGSSAVSLDTKVVGVHLHFEETVLTPVGAPGVATDPVFAAQDILTVTYNTDSVVQFKVINNLGVDTVGVITEFISGLDTTFDGTVLSEFRFHIVGTRETVVLANVVLSVSHGSATAKTIITSLWHWGCTILTEVVVGAR